MLPAVEMTAASLHAVLTRVAARRSALVNQTTASNNSMIRVVARMVVATVVIAVMAAVTRAVVAMRMTVPTAVMMMVDIGMAVPHPFC